jgi:hypothetical protein
MLIFQQEKNDNLEELIKSTASIAYESVVFENTKPQRIADVNKILAFQNKANKNQKDLYYVNTILVSTGWNKNDDVFFPDRLFAARNTPEDKQFNLMHDENDIIGHITGSCILDRENNLVLSETEYPEEFDILTESVLYRAWSNPENQERIEKIIAEIKEGLWYVSMECLFESFDYAVVDEKGKAYVIDRSEASAYLTKHLRSYGGTGEYQGHKIGRALKGISFSGKGLVSKPANPRSIIIRTEASQASFSPTEINKVFNGDINMDLEKKLAEAEANYKNALAQIEQLKSEASQKQAEELKSLAEAKDKALAEAQKTFESAKAEFEKTAKATEEELSNTKAALKVKSEELAKAQEELNKIVAERKTEARVNKLVTAGFSVDDAKESVADYNELSDEAFDKIVAKWMPFKKDEKKDEKKEDKAKSEEDMKKKDKKEDKAKCEEASDETFADTKSQASLNDVETDDLSSTKKALATWFEASLGIKNGENK